MLRGLYRFYLYTVFIALLLFATFGIQGLIQTFLAQTIFRDQFNTPGNADLVRAIVFAVVSVVTATVFGGLHYWLLRRDMRGDPGAGNGGIRAFFLNFVELISLPLAVGLGTSAISVLGQQNSSGASYGAAFAITFLGLWALLEWERRRIPASSGAALIFQRLHLYGTQLILLFIFSFSWLSTVGLLVDEFFFAGKGSGVAVCGGFKICQGPNLLSNIAATCWIALFWIGYGFLSRHDTASLLRRVLHFISFGYGVIFILAGVYRGASLLLLAMLKVAVEQNSISGPFAEYDVVSPLTLGLLIAGVYLLWLRKAVQKQPAERTSVFLTLHAIAAALFGVGFWYGCGLLLLNLLEYAAPSSTALTAENWANAIALIVAGIGYVPLEILLRLRSRRAAFTTALRGFVLTLLGGGILAGAIGGATALYAYGTYLLGSPFNNWQYVAHTGLAALAVGIVVVGLYLWTSIRAHFFSSSGKPQESTTATPSAIAPAAPVKALAEDTSATSLVRKQAAPITTAPAVTSVTISETVDELLAGKLTREEAVARLEAFYRSR